jgi:hypothetical protein
MKKWRVIIKLSLLQAHSQESIKLNELCSNLNTGRNVWKQSINMTDFK